MYIFTLELLVLCLYQKINPCGLATVTDGILHCTAINLFAGLGLIQTELTWSDKSQKIISTHNFLQ